MTDKDVMSPCDGAVFANGLNLFSLNYFTPFGCFIFQ